MDNAMLYKMFLNSLNSMNDDELAKSLLKVKSLLNQSDYEKLLMFIKAEREKQGK